MGAKKLQLEVNNAFIEDKDTAALANKGILITPPVGKDDYWLFRVKLSDKNAVIGFPKFGTIGIGFEVETDWNTNLPYSCDANEIYNHIKHNGARFSSAKVILAIKMIQDAVKDMKQ